jgi:ribonucleoside-triphosphate reductase (thioredoxin)
MYVTHRYIVTPQLRAEIEAKIPVFGFNGFGEATYYRTYSRQKSDGSQENWSDTVIRVVEGVQSIRKDWYKKHGLPIDTAILDDYASRLAHAIFDMKMLPPGRGLWAMGTDFVFDKGGMALNNCAAVEVKKLSVDMNWAMDALMCGVGVGFGVFRENAQELKDPKRMHNPLSLIQQPEYQKTYYQIPDTREGWVESVKLLLGSYEEGSPYVAFDYSNIRPYGSPIKGFGGKASGPDPLIKLHGRIRRYCDRYVRGECGWSRLCADIANAIGACVVAGNVRRSAEILLGHIDDPEFVNLKNYDLADHVIYDGHLYQCTEYHCSGDVFDHQYWMMLCSVDKASAKQLHTANTWSSNTYYDGRSSLGWMSNNTVRLEKKSDFRQIPKIARLIGKNGEPGIANLVNMQEYGRFGDRLKEDKANLANPCSEICLESYELCNLSEVFPTRCNSKREFYEALELATYYSSTVSLLPTHRPETNEVVNRNHRIGISISGIADWFDAYGAADCIPMLRKGYKIVKRVNETLAKEAGVNPSIRLTTVKPSGTISQLAGVSSGMHFPTFQYAIRRMRVSEGSELVPILQMAGVPWEKDVYSDNTLVFEFPIDQGKTRPANEVSAWEQFSLLSSLQREWADNMVSCTIYFDPKSEEKQIEHMLGQFAPTIKSVSMLPHTDAGAYVQMPYEGITREEYERRQDEIAHIDWDAFGGSDGQDSRFCTNDVCSILPLSNTVKHDTEMQQET